MCFGLITENYRNILYVFFVYMFNCSWLFSNHDYEKKLFMSFVYGGDRHKQKKIYEKIIENTLTFL